LGLGLKPGAIESERRRTGSEMWKQVLLVAGAAYGMFLCFLFIWMCQPPMVFAGMMKYMPGPLYLTFPFETMWTHARAGALEPGQVAPDFELPTADHKSQIQLSSFRGSKPVVLVFGSYT
jgi:hypothetical protein